MPIALRLSLGLTLGNSLGNIYDFAFSPVVSSGLEGWWNFGQTAALTVRNRAPGKADGSIVGSPIINSDGTVRFQSLTNFLQTQMDETDDHTVMVVAKTADTLADAAHRPAFFSNYNGPAAANGAITSDGTMLWISGSTNARFQTFRRASDGSSTNAGSSNTLPSPSSAANWSILVGVSNGLRIDIYDKTAGATSGFTHTLPRYRGSQKLRFGSSYTFAGGHCDMAHGAYWSRVLSTEEIDAVVNQVRTYQANRFGRTI